MNTDQLFAAHSVLVNDQLAAALSASAPGCDAVLIHSGNSQLYFADDHAPPFRAWGHFLRYVPVDRPNHFVLLAPGRKPRFFPLIPADFWHDPHLDMPAWWADCFDVQPLADVSELARHLSHSETRLFLGEDSKLATALGIPADLINPPALLHWLDFERAYKTPYEVHRIAEANAHALTGHQAAQQAFLAGGSEFDIHLAYLQACQVLDQELPYSSIVAVNTHAATLHYQHKQRYPGNCGEPAGRLKNQVLLIDAGCRAHGYCSDITRTWTTPDTPVLFRDLLAGMEKLQQEVIAHIKPGMSYIDLHVQTHRWIADLLIASGICKGTADALVESGVSYAFFPHGLGHLLGLQVHDSGGRLADRNGRTVAPPPAHPALRTTRAIATGMVFTIEPGLYFIPSLLAGLRADQRRSAVDWQLVDQLAPLGGIRIEDNVWVHDSEVHNLTRTPLTHND